LSMNIPSPSPIVFPAAPEKTFPHLWIKRLLLASPSVDDGKMEAHFSPYNADTREIGPSAFDIEFTTEELWTAIAEVPEVAAAYAAILDSVAPMIAWLSNRNQNL
jgi:hypothetical protein